MHSDRMCYYYAVTEMWTAFSHMTADWFIRINLLIKQVRLPSDTVNENFLWLPMLIIFNFQSLLNWKTGLVVTLVMLFHY